MYKYENLNNLKPGLYCVATPIGNLGDITFRAIELLKNSDFILCEDTRVSKKLLDKFEIKTKLISNHKFNEVKNLSKITDLLKNDKIVIFTGTVAHPMVTEATRIARMRGIPIERTHSSSVSALKRCLEGFIESEATS